MVSSTDVSGEPNPSAAPVLDGGSWIGKYQVIRRLAVGGMVLGGLGTLATLGACFGCLRGRRRACLDRS